MLDATPSDAPADLVCSARGCRATAVHALRWNNPKLHTPERRKTWLACHDHLGSLGDFLRLRGFLRETVAASDLAALDDAATVTDGPAGAAGAAGDDAEGARA